MLKVVHVLAVIERLLKDGDGEHGKNGKDDGVVMKKMVVVVNMVIVAKMVMCVSE